MIVNAPDRRIQLRAAEELPFSLHAALAAGAPRWAHGHPPAHMHAPMRVPGQQPMQMQLMRMATTSDPAGAAEESEALVRAPEERMTYWRMAQWCALFAFVGFILVIVVLAGVMATRVADMAEDLDSSTLSMQMQAVIDHAHQAASNTEQATLNVLSMSELAKQGLLHAAPRLGAAFNESTNAVHSVTEFASHPSVTLSAG